MGMKRKSLGFKLVTGGIVVVLIPLLVVGLFSIMKSSGALETISKERAVNVATDTAAMAELVMAEEIKVISQLSLNEVLVEAATTIADRGVTATDAAEFDEMVRAGNTLRTTIKKLGSDYENLYLVDTSGVVLAGSSEKSLIGLSLASRGYVQTALAGKINIGNVIISKSTGNPVVPICAPVYSQDGKIIGATGATMSINFLSENITNIKLGETGYPFLVNKEGWVIAHPNKDLVLKTNMKDMKGMEIIAERALAQQTGTESYTFKGVDKISAFAPVKLTGWSVCATQDEAEFLAAARSMRDFILLIGGIFLALTILAVFYFSRSLTRPITEAVAMLNSAADQVAAASTQVSSASQSLAEGSAESASAIEETSSSLEEISSMTRQNADNAGQADGLMKEANQVVIRADQSMTELTGSMGEISHASEETSKIIKTIDEIAFQTNLLALNAAVEAARAGEAGAGFAVVADEVRNLAMRAAEAAKNTADLIEGSVKKIKEGSELVEKTNTAFEEVTKSSAKVGQLVGEIAAASSEQAQGIDQVNKAIGEMDKVTQQNAANAEESASASEEMNAQAAQLKDIAAQLLAAIGGDGAGGHNGDGGVEMRRVQRSSRSAAKPLPTSVRDVALSARKREVSPNQVIPLDDGEFRDF